MSELGRWQYEADYAKLVGELASQVIQKAPIPVEIRTFRTIVPARSPPLDHRLASTG